MRDIPVTVEVPNEPKNITAKTEVIPQTNTGANILSLNQLLEEVEP